MEKARKAMSPLLSLIADFKIPCKKSLKLFHSFIKPIALYNSENMSHLTLHQIRAIEENKTNLLTYLTKSEINTIHQKFLKYIIGVKRNCSNMATLGELGEFPLHLYGLTSLLSFWHRATQMQDDSLVKQALSLISEVGQSSEWFATVKFILKSLDMEEYFLDSSIITTNQFTNMCSKRLHKLLIKQWKTAISSNFSNSGRNNKLRFYSCIKASFEMEPYLDNVNDFNMRKAICKFRCSDHQLEIEKGRHNNLNVEERICQVCNSDIESEMHFLINCPLYEALRYRYFESNQESVLINLLKCSDKATAFNMGNYIMKAMKLRKDTLTLQSTDESTE